MTQPTPPIELNGSADHLEGDGHPLPVDLTDRLRCICSVTTDLDETAEASRDWWPLTLHWSLAGEVARRAPVAARPDTAEQVAAIVGVCNDAGVPVTAAGGRSGVCGASLPVFGGVVLDLTALDAIGDIDAVSGVIEVEPGVFGPELEHAAAEHGLTVGHFPQSFDIATVGGWVACRGAGQYSTRYGKIEDMVVGLEVVLADGRVIHTGGSPAAAVGPDLNQLFIGSEGTLGIITKIWLRAHRVAPTRRQAPAVLRLYDGVESQRGHGGDGTTCALLVLDEGDDRLVDATMAIVDEVCSADGSAADGSLVDDWFEHRNDTTALQGLTRKGFVVDTMEIAAPWSRLDDVYRSTTEALMAVPNVLVASCHLSHSYLDGACLYFTFAARPATDEIEPTYVAMSRPGP